jgi:hypothetical protein
MTPFSASIKRVASPAAELGHELAVELVHRLLGDRLERPPAVRERDPVRAPVGGIALARDEPRVLALAHEPGHRLLGEAGGGGDLADPQRPALEQRNEHGAVGRPDVGEPALGKAGDEPLVEALRGLRQEEPDV